MPHHEGERSATAVGMGAILLWSTLALLTTSATQLPPFELLALTFGIATLVGIGHLALRGRRAWAALRQPWYVWAPGVAAFFCFHAFYFYALRHAPAAQASLVVYLWPMLIVLFAASGPGAGPGRAHLLGAGLGFLGTWTLLGGGAERWSAGHVLGYTAALASALTWSTYSVVQRRLAHVPTEIVTVYCAGTAALGAACHLLLEAPVAPTPANWAAVVALGLGPVGAAFFAWDHGTKHGNLPLLGTLSYAAPLVSTLLLVAFGRAEPTWQLGLGALLVAAGAGVASRGARRGRAGPQRGVPVGGRRSGALGAAVEPAPPGPGATPAAPAPAAEEDPAPAASAAAARAPIRVRVERDVSLLSLAVFQWSAAAAADATPLERALEGQIQRLRELSLEALLDRRELRTVRKRYNALGRSASQYRSSAETLVRAAVQGEVPLGDRIRDAAHLLSLHMLLPICSLDADRLEGDLILRYGRPGETSQDEGRVLDLEGVPLLADERGPVGSPVCETARARARADSLRVVTVVWCFQAGQDLANVLAAGEQLLQRVGTVHAAGVYAARPGADAARGVAPHASAQPT